MNRWIISGSIAALCVVAVSISIRIPQGIDDLRLIGVFSTDEYTAVELALKGLERNTLYPWGFYNYGYFYHTLCIAVVKTVQLSGHAHSVWAVAFVFRLISLVSLIAVSILVFNITRVLTPNNQIACVSGLLVVSAASVFYWAGRAHPDVLQMALVSAAVLVVIRKQSVRSTILASFLTGVAFGTKYAGFFLLPFLLIPAGLMWWGLYGRFDRAWIRSWVGLAASCLLLFLAAWLITNPYAVSHFRAFYTDLLSEARHVATGHGRIEPANPFLWLAVLSKDFTPLGLALLSIGIIAVVVDVIGSVRAGGVGALRNERLRAKIFLLAFLGFGILYAVAVVKMRRPRFLFHLYPAMVVLGVYGLYALSKPLEPARRWLPVLLWICVLALGFKTISGSFGSPKIGDHPYVKAGAFIGANYERDTKILADAYSYVPEGFEHVTFVWGVDHEKIEENAPQLIIINKGLSGRWSWKREGTGFRELALEKGDFDNAGHYLDFHRRFFADPGWKIILEDDDVVLLERAEPGL